jgi:hypothetical protein
VLPWSHELQSDQPYQPPFVARFEKGDQILSFVAVQLIDDVLAKRHVRLAIIEGWPAAQGINPPRYARKLQEWNASGFCKGGGEDGYAAFHAVEHGASFLGGEPDERLVVQAVLNQGFTPEDLLGFYFVRQVPQLRREGTLAAKGLEASFRTLIDAMGKRAGLEDAGAHLSLEQFRDWYRKRQGKEFDVATLDDAEPAPVATGTYFTQRLSSVVGLVRDRFIVQVIASHLATDKDVLVVYGGSHFATQRPAFELLLGKPVEEKPGGT